MSVPSNVKLLLCLNDNSEVALSIPLAQCAAFATYPLKWLRFLGFIVYGRKGRLTTSANGPELDYRAQIEARSYYFISNGPPCFPDVDAMDNRTSNASDLSTGRTGFRERLIQRDGTCALSGNFAQYCDACHIIPHSKGNNYMSNLFDHRRGAYGLMDPLDDINDTRNGILLSSYFHRALDAGDIAFLMTPNFALTVDDVPYHHQPGAESPTNRFTLQYFKPCHDQDLAVSHFGPRNSDARQPQDISQWPPAIIVDLCYAVAVLKAWGPKPFVEYLRTNSMDFYYGEGVEDDNGEGATGDPSAQAPLQPTTRELRYKKRSEENARAVDPADQPTREDMFDLVMGLWTRAAREAAEERRLPGNSAEDVSDNKDRVETWLQSME